MTYYCMYTDTPHIMRLSFPVWRSLQCMIAPPPPLLPSELRGTNQSDHCLQLHMVNNITVYVWIVYVPAYNYA